ncbi:MAG: hypothetical protein AAB448_01140 [Patescibacteria group bacterium]
MKIFGKQNKETSQQNAVPGVLTLLKQTHALAKQERILLAGYAAWIMMPALATFGVTFLSLSSFWESTLTNIILVGDILLGTWVGACLTLVAMSRLRKEPLEEREISTRARKALPVLLYLFAFSLFCVVAGTYLLVLPGIVAFVWLAFTDVAALEKSGVTFSHAITSSKNLSKGRFLNVFWKLLAGNAVLGMVYFVLCLLVLGSAFAAAGINPTELLNGVLTAEAKFPSWIPLLLTALSLPLIPYTAIYTVALYDGLKTR